MSYGALSVEGGSNLLKEADVEMLDEEEDKEKEEEEDAAGVTSTVQDTVETESEGGGSGNCREQLLAKWLKGGDLLLAVGAMVALESFVVSSQRIYTQSSLPVLLPLPPYPAFPPPPLFSS